MTNPQKRKGDKGELEAAALLHDLLGVPARRKLGAGRLDDHGDIDGVPNTTIQVYAGTTNVVARGLVAKPLECEQQQANAKTTFGATMIRIRGGQFRIVMTPTQFATLWREATNPGT